MKHICKNRTAHENFKSWKKRNKGADWKDFSGTSEHKEFRSSLLEEQFSMCCYCEVKIFLDDSHIEHLKPKSTYRKEIFSSDNLLASCNNKDSCGHKKGRWYKPEMVSPLDKDCEKRFTYTLDGRIIPSDKQDIQASETIEQLGLNCSRLQDRRKSIILGMDNKGQGPEADDPKILVGQTLEKERSWPFGFYTVLLFLAELYDIPISLGIH